MSVVLVCFQLCTIKIGRSVLLERRRKRRRMGRPPIDRTDLSIVDTSMILSVIKYKNRGNVPAW